MYQIVLGKKVKKFLKQHEKTAKAFYKKLPLLTINPTSDRIDCKPLQGKKDHFRLRIGKYRFLYEIKNEEILIYFYEANSRGDVY